jgi:hypothetical protein
MDESAYSTLLKYVENTEYTENLRQYDTFVALAIAFNLGRNKLTRPGPFSLGYSFRPAPLA